MPQLIAEQSPAKINCLICKQELLQINGNGYILYEHSDSMLEKLRIRNRHKELQHQQFASKMHERDWNEAQVQKAQSIRESVCANDGTYIVIKRKYIIDSD
jgi:hypothetical protein